ncbi:MAG: ATP synthase F0 subunit B [Acidobacteriota bacterium]
MTPDLSVLVVIAFVLATTLLLNGLIFQPILRVMREREQAVTGARELAQSAAEKAAAASAEYQRTLSLARGEVYQQMDEKRRSALDQRAAILAATRAEVERELAEATSRVNAQSADARAALDREARTLAGAIVERVLGRAS